MSLGSLRLRLLLAGAVSIFVALGLAAFGLTLLFKQHVERRVDVELNVYLDQLVAGLDRSPSGDLAVVHSPADPRFDQPLSGLYWQIDVGNGGKVLRSRSLWDSALSLPAETDADDAVRHHEISGPGGAKLYLLQRYIELPDRLGGSNAKLAVALDAEDIAKSVRSFASELMPFLLLIGTLLAAASWAQVSIGLRPLTAIRTSLAAIRSGEAQRLGKEFPDEVRPLAEEINALLNEREAAIEKAKGRAADLAHGFKTPLQVLNVEAERLKSKGEREIASEISSLTEAMRRHVDRELARARLSYSAKDAMAGVKAVVDRVVRVIERTPQGQELEWTLSIPQELNARIDADDLAEVLGNLIENAARHAKTGVSVSAQANGSSVEIAVADDGSGIAEDRQREILARGQRLDTLSDGAGLGLAIVTDVLDAWGGSLALANGRPGLVATVRLPVATPRTQLS